MKENEKLKIRHWECQKCGKIISMQDPDPTKYVDIKPKQPAECYKLQGGCGRISHFKEVRDDWYQKNRKTGSSDPVFDIDIIATGVIEK